MRPKKWVLRLVQETDDQYTLHTDNFGTMLCGEQYAEFMNVIEIEVALEKLEESNKGAKWSIESIRKALRIAQMDANARDVKGDK